MLSRCLLVVLLLGLLFAIGCSGGNPVSPEVEAGAGLVDGQSAGSDDLCIRPMSWSRLKEMYRDDEEDDRPEKDQG